MSLLRQAGRVAAKDLRIEMRSREILSTITFFGIVVVVIFTIAFPRDIRLVRVAAPGMLWSAIAFAGTLGLGRAFDRERENDTMRALLLSPTPRLAIFLGKALSIAILVIIVTIVVATLLAVFANVPFGQDVPMLAVILLLGTIGFAIVGTVFSATLLKVRSRDVLLPVIMYPLLVPLFVGGTYATEQIIAVTPDIDAAWSWIRFVGIYDAVFLVVSVWIFESLVIE